ncbi:MAG: amino acid ABC transporter substrate-binding protein [Actinobacteria bacterium]|nr:amino acid ABC transporter substrate-binding protein [Actinomycetota bacterium]
MFFRHRRRATRSILATTMVVAALASACSDERLQGDGESLIAPTSLPMPEGATGVDVGVALAGVSGARTTWAPTERFRSGIAATDAGANDLVTAAAAYDAVVVAALSAEMARSDASGRIAAGIPAATGVGSACGDFERCRTPALEEKDFDYEGASGPLTLDRMGTPTQADFVTVTVSPSGRTVSGDPIGGQLRVDESLGSPTDQRRGKPADGVLRIGTILPVGSNPDDAIRSARAGVQHAVAEINNPVIGGVLGRPLELIADSSGTGTEAELIAAANALVAAGADVVIGATDERSARIVLPILSAAGVALISPLDPTPEASIGDPDGLYFRTTPTDELSGRVLGQLASYNGVTDAIAITGAPGSQQAFAQRAIDALVELDGTVSAEIPFVAGDDPAAIADMIAAATPKSIIIATDRDTTTALASELAARGFGPAAVPWFAAPWVFTAA